MTVSVFLSTKKKKTMNAMEETPSADIHNHLKSICLLLSAFAAKMLSFGATSQRIDSYIHQIAHAYHVETEMSILPKRVLVATYSKGHAQSYTNVGETVRWGINLSALAKLYKLAQELEKGELSAEEGMRRIAHIEHEGQTNRWCVLLAVGCANASFCRLFGGDCMAMLIVWVATIDGFYLKQRMMRRQIDSRIVTYISALFAAIIGASGIIFRIGTTPNIALATSVLYLVPGIPFINAMSDVLHGHHLCATSRMADAVITTVCLSLGLCTALQLTRIGWN